jgi:hypothetical protein
LIAFRAAAFSNACVEPDKSGALGRRRQHQRSWTPSRKGPRQTALRTLDVLPRRIIKVENEDELSQIEQEVDDFIGVQLAKFVSGEEDALEVSTLILAAQRLMAGSPVIAPAFIQMAEARAVP